jgi:dTDP-4-dehydrorhamnose 3,5-epimerase
MAIQKLDTKFSGAAVFVPDVHEDDRGFFKETYSVEKYRSLGLHDAFVQDSVSYSMPNVGRGLHFDLKMSKFIQVLRGKVFDVIVDIRRDSETYLQWQGFYLSETNHRQLYVPAGFAQGFLTLGADVVFSYKHGSLYDAKTEGAIRWNDPTLAIEWPVASPPRISLKDQTAPLLADAAFPH